MARGVKLKLPRCEKCGTKFLPCSNNAGRFCSRKCWHSVNCHGIRTIKRARVLWDAGYSQSQIGIRLSMTKNAIAGLARRNGFPKRPVPLSFAGNLKENHLEIISRAQELWNQGYSAGVIARTITTEFGETCTKNRIIGIAHRYPGFDTHPEPTGMKRLSGGLKKGSDLHCAKLTEVQIPEIRKLLASGVAPRVIADKYGVAASTIRYLDRGQSWKHVS